MTTEEKAKAYDKAIERAKEKLTNEIASDIFPELAASEDERIRKEIIDFIYDNTDTYELREKSNSWLSWLEKQREQKPKIEYVYPKFRIGDVIEPIKYNGHPIRVKNIFDCSYNCESDDGKDFLSLPIHRENEYKLTEQKPWSEEDEARFESCIKILQTSDGYDTINIKWLKSLKDRVGCEVNCTTTWKPSEEQIKALASALSLANNCGEESAFDLRTLYDKLLSQWRNHFIGED